MVFSIINIDTSYRFKIFAIKISMNYIFEKYKNFILENKYP